MTRMPSSRHTVSVVIPVWNRASWIGDALDSVAQQTRAPEEVIVVDDGSTDGTADVAAAHPLVPSVVTIAHAGVAAARNRGIEAARGDLVAFLDSDDLWLPEKLARHVPMFTGSDAPALGCTHYEVWDRVGDAWTVSQTRRHPGPLDVETLLAMNRIGTLTVVARRAELLARGGFDETLVRGSDYDLWLRCAEREPVHVLEEVLAIHRRHPDRLTGTDPEQDARTRNEIVAARAQRVRSGAE
jgi:glycosyltransferase involved in cell wall biosynthesis